MDLWNSVRLQVSYNTKFHLFPLNQNINWFAYQNSSTFGSCLLSLFAWLTRDWIYLGLVGSLPALVPLLCYKIIPASPRWLVAKNRLVEASLILEKVATVNGKCAKSTTILEVLKHLKLNEDGGQNPSLRKLFSQRNLAFNTVMLAVTYAMHMYPNVDDGLLWDYN